jgi:hypothetical protein
MQKNKSRFTGHNLGLQVLGYSVLWASISGMRWDELVPIVHSMTNCLPKNLSADLRITVT